MAIQAGDIALTKLPDPKSKAKERPVLVLEVYGLDCLVVAITSLFDADHIKTNQIRLPVNDFTNLWKECGVRLERGPGFVAPIGTAAHFPPVVANTPPVDLFAIEHQSRDSAKHPGLDGIKGTLDDAKMSWRFDANPAFIPADAKTFLKTFPESYGFQSGRLPYAQGRGIATLPGGMPLYKARSNDTLALVGGIGVFFPGRDGFASYEQNFVPASDGGAAGPQSNSDPWTTSAGRFLPRLPLACGKRVITTSPRLTFIRSFQIGRATLRTLRERHSVRLLTTDCFPIGLTEGCLERLN